MPFGLVPILAQAFTVAVGDRAEVRWVANENTDYYEAENRAFIAGTLAGRHSRVGIDYSPSVIVTPLEDADTRNDYYFHHAGLAASIDWLPSRRTTVTASQTAAYDRSDARIQALSGGLTPPGSAPATGLEPPGDPTGDPGVGPAAPTTNVFSSPNIIEIVSARSELAVNHLLSRRSGLRTFVGYGGSTGIGDSRPQFPLIQGPDGGSTYTYRLSRTDDLSTIFTARYSFSATGDRAFLATLSEAWSHRFSRYAQMTISAGLTYIYSDPDDGPAQHDFFFGSGAGGQLGVTISHVTNLYGGRLTLTAGAAYAPVLEQSRVVGDNGQQLGALTPDVRIGVFSGATWVRKRLTLYANLASIVSAEPSDPGALNAIAGQLGSIYDLGAGFNFETGARGGYQTFNGVELLQPSVAVFVALSWNGVLLQTR